MMLTAFILYFPFLYIRNELTTKYGLSAKHREKYPVTRIDLNILIQHLYTSDTHDYVHERGRFQQAFGLSLFSSSRARAGAIVESNTYQDINKALYYQHLSLNMRPEFLKGHRYDDETILPKNWIGEQKILKRAGSTPAATQASPQDFGRFGIFPGFGASPLSVSIFSGFGGFSMGGDMFSNSANPNANAALQTGFSGFGGFPIGGFSGFPGIAVFGGASAQVAAPILQSGGIVNGAYTAGSTATTSNTSPATIIREVKGLDED
ncbi:hypothetical protein BGW36DRAFT_410141 [Talaromyces proteolyticus]|uniref:Uncharacterized protein n=1 Tax=Talaromyces proteolyticus TaxID=1131652 RepID=A0AAD4PXQ1_9EURO|nr:uncharacterized protein BGW36DRAFT_410141 [Talaromyces proteolyticus]KAH8692973.1 hypothetical protein BGW36DRAFT_410141 [Talaromyces proteolyticus]